MERHKSPDCPMLRLPAELRNKIYELVFEDGRDTIDVNATFLFPRHTSSKTDNAIRRKKSTAATPSSALLRCCHQIQNETRGIFAAACERYWRKTFTIDLNDIWPSRYFIGRAPWHLMSTLEATTHSLEQMLVRARLVRLNRKWYLVETESVDRDPEQGGSRHVRSTRHFVGDLNDFLLDFAPNDPTFDDIF